MAEDVLHLHASGEQFTACGLDPWTDPEEENPDLWVHSTERHGSVTCEACRATFTPAPAVASPVLDLVRQYGDEWARAVKVANMQGGYTASEERRASAEALFARLAELLPQQPVQARDEAGIPLFIHACGHVSPESTPGVDEGEHHRFPPCRTPGPWRPLLVARTDAPAPQSRADEVRQAVAGMWSWQDDGPRSLDMLLNELIDKVSRDEWSDSATMSGVESLRDYILARWPLQPDILSAVMAELGVDRPEDALVMIGELQRAIERACNERDAARAELQHHLDSVDRLAGERNEARTELERYQRLLKAQASNFSAAVDRVTAERDEVRAESEARLDALIKTRAEREELDDRAANALAEVERLKRERDAWIEQARQAGVKLEQFKAAAPVHDGVLRLPEVPEGTVALRGERTGRRYTLNDGWWTWDDGDTSWIGDLTALLADEGSLRVELAPPREPRTAAAIWRETAEDDREYLHGSAFYGELKAALDREAGLTEVFDDEPGGAS